MHIMWYLNTPVRMSAHQVNTNHYTPVHVRFYWHTTVQKHVISSIQKPLFNRQPHCKYALSRGFVKNCRQTIVGDLKSKHRIANEFETHAHTHTDKTLNRTKRHRAEAPQAASGDVLHVR